MQYVLYLICYLCNRRAIVQPLQSNRYLRTNRQTVKDQVQSALSLHELKLCVNNLLTYFLSLGTWRIWVPHGAVNGKRKNHTRTGAILGSTQLQPSHSMGEVAKSTQNGPRREDKYRTRRTPTRETDNNCLPSGTSGRTTC